MPAKIEKHSTEEINNRLNRDPIRLFKDAYEHGMNLAAFLDRLSPRESKGDLRAFDRLLQHRGIVVQGDMSMGYYPSKVSDFLDDTGGRALLQEFCAIQWRKVLHRPQQRVYLSSDGTPGSWQNPYADAEQARWDQDIAPAIPLDAMIAMTTPIDTDLYRSFYLTYAAEQLRQFRVGESAEIPIAKLADSENTIQLKKYGRGLSASYEQLRRMRVDKLAMQVAFMAVQSEIDKVDAALDIIVNGDGNSNSPTTHDLTVLDTGASAGTLTLAGWLAFKKKLANPYVMTTALMQEAVAQQLELLDMGSSNVALLQLANADIIGTITPINMTANAVSYGWLTAAPALQIVAWDRRRALEQVIEIASDITETERFITNQTEVLIMSEISGFAVLDANASKILDVNA